jgi:hypothetical protein
MGNRRHGGVLGGQFVSATEREREINFAKTRPIESLHAKMRSRHATHATDPIPAPSVGHHDIPNEQYSRRII